MKRTKNIILTSIMAITASSAVIVGSTYALLNESEKTDIVISAGDVKVTAEVGTLTTFSVKPDASGTIVDENGGTYILEEQTSGTFANGGTATYENGVLSINKMSPGDKIATKITINNQSTIAAKYRTRLLAKGILAYGLDISIDGVKFSGLNSTTNWEDIALDFTKDVEVEISMPMDALSSYGGTSATITFKVEAVQGNAAVVDQTVVKLDEFIELVKASNGTFDGKDMLVRWSPEDVVPNKENSRNAVYYIYSNNVGTNQETATVDVKNVNFEYVPGSFDVGGSWTAESVKNAQLYFQNLGDLTFTNCTFNRTVLTHFEETNKDTIKDCTFVNIYNSYAIKDIKANESTVENNTFINCGAGVMLSRTNADNKVVSMNVINNTFINIDVNGTAPADKVGTRGIVQIASVGDYTGATLNLTGNTYINCGYTLRQLSDSFRDYGTINSDTEVTYTTDSKLN